MLIIKTIPWSGRMVNESITFPKNQFKTNTRRWKHNLLGGDNEPILKKSYGYYSNLDNIYKMGSANISAKIVKSNSTVHVKQAFWVTLPGSWWMSSSPVDCLGNEWCFSCCRHPTQTWRPSRCRPSLSPALSGAISSCDFAAPLHSWSSTWRPQRSYGTSAPLLHRLTQPLTLCLQTSP